VTLHLAGLGVTVVYFSVYSYLQFTLLYILSLFERLSGISSQIYTVAALQFLLNKNSYTKFVGRLVFTTSYHLKFRNLTAVLNVHLLSPWKRDADFAYSLYIYKNVALNKLHISVKAITTYISGH
jgi:hypothetical protein